MAAAILFSGGRDSTLAACLALGGGERPVHLLTFENGLGHGPNLVHLRVQELRDALGPTDCEHHVLSIRGLTQLISLRNIERDLRDFETNLVTLGSALAMIARATVFAKLHGVASLVTGYSGYQKHFPEQADVAVGWFGAFVASHGLTLTCPVREHVSARAVKDDLLLYDISGKSLERSSMFADSFSDAADDAIVAYLESKRAIADAFVGKHTRAGAR